MRTAAFVVSLMFLATPALAEPPKVVTDIGPVHGLVSMVMEGVGTPDVLLQPNASAHDFALRPSQAGQVSDADVIIWVGSSLAPQLEEAFQTLAPDAERLTLDQLSVTLTLEARALDDFGEAHGGHDHSHSHDHDHGAHGSVDPHMWLDPANAAAWLVEIADVLTALDPANGPAYAANARTGAAQINELSDEIASQLSAAPSVGFLVSHDAFQYFEAHFDRSAIGAVSLSDAVSPSPKHLGELREKIAQANVSCVLVEPLTNTGLIDAAAGSATLKAIEADPMGAGLPLGASFYPALLEQMGEAFISCFDPTKRY